MNEILKLAVKINLYIFHACHCQKFIVKKITEYNFAKFLQYKFLSKILVHINQFHLKTYN